jgi:antitoxin MazE
MRAVIRQIGKSLGVILPHGVLAQIGVKLGDTLDLTVSGGKVLLTKAGHPRAGWHEASAAIATAGDDALVWGHLTNDGDADLPW